MHIESIPIERINPAMYNPRVDLQPGDRDYDRLQRSMDEFGFVEPLVWNRRTGNLVGGQQRLKILAARGVKGIEVSVVDLPPEREQALNVALNKIGGDWDDRKLADLLTGLAQIPDFDVSLTGFDATEMTHLLDGLEALDDEDDFDLADALEAAQYQPPRRRIGFGWLRLLDANCVFDSAGTGDWLRFASFFSPRRLGVARKLRRLARRRLWETVVVMAHSSSL